MRLLLVLAAACASAGCLALGAPRPAPDGPELRPERFFDGTTTGLGTLAIRGRGTQMVRVESTGRAGADGVFELVQTIRLGDGPPRTRTWTMRPTGPDTYTGTLTDARGPVDVRVDGSRLTIRYAMPGPWVRMRQTLTLMPDGQTALNTSTVTVLGVPWARLSEQIRRAPLR